MHFLHIKDGVKNKIIHNIVPINLHSSINSIGVSQSSNVCPILTDLGQSIFTNIVVMEYDAIWTLLLQLL